ncbi:Uncharacterized protein SCF082_LOCUS34427 [Durusdinium trenchii]|uniref:PNPLA domain-containing protein n=1 Tax=Durusdinium trenchii TaxID=1381693 RepID=A0ABP0NWZ2_9DINO
MQVAEELIASVKPEAAPSFNAHAAGLRGAGQMEEHSTVKKATALAIYGCGILAATHVGGLRALERHGMQYSFQVTCTLCDVNRLKGVSAGSVVAAMLAVGCQAEEIFQLVQELPFYKIALPELGALAPGSEFLEPTCDLEERGVVTVTRQSILETCLGESAAAVVECLADGTGPGLNSGSILEEMIGNALKQHCGDADITLKAVQDRKRLVILACELDSGKERRFTPETDPELPLRAAVRMSMGVPGLMEPFKYRGEAAGRCQLGVRISNDFPMNALPSSEVRIGLMVRPVDWIQHHIAGLDPIIPEESLQKFPKAPGQTRMPALFSVKTILDLAMTSVNIMMDANLVLQIAAATAKMNLTGGGISELAPEILTLCGGRLDPFDFNLSKEQHRELYFSGQLSTHLHASMVDKSSEVLSDEAKLKLLLFSMHLDYPTN